MFVKLYNSLIMSSLWSEDSDTRVLWITMLATADRDGFIFGSPAGLAAMARLPIEAVLIGLEKFKNPDTLSTDLMRNPENEGRRIEAIDGGWRLLNYDFYRGLERAEDRKAQYRESKAFNRWKSKNGVDGPRMSRHVSKVPPSEAEADAVLSSLKSPPSVQETESLHTQVGTASPPPRVRTNGFRKPTFEEVKARIAEKGYEIDPVKWYAYYESNGWRVGKNSMKNWKAALVTWARGD